MSKVNKTSEKKAEKQAEENQMMKVLEHNLVLNSFNTHCQFTRDFGIELLKGSATAEHIEVLKKSIEGINQFISLLEDKF